MPVLPFPFRFCTYSPRCSLAFSDYAAHTPLAIQAGPCATVLLSFKLSQVKQSLEYVNSSNLQWKCTTHTLWYFTSGGSIFHVRWKHQSLAAAVGTSSGLSWSSEYRVLFNANEYSHLQSYQAHLCTHITEAYRTHTCVPAHPTRASQQSTLAYHACMYSMLTNNTHVPQTHGSIQLQVPSPHVKKQPDQGQKRVLRTH